jgi:hypothetical protein
VLTFNKNIDGASGRNRTTDTGIFRGLKIRVDM